MLMDGKSEYRLKQYVRGWAVWSRWDRQRVSEIESKKNASAVLKFLKDHEKRLDRDRR